MVLTLVSLVASSKQIHAREQITQLPRRLWRLRRVGLDTGDLETADDSQQVREVSLLAAKEVRRDGGTYAEVDWRMWAACSLLNI